MSYLRRYTRWQFRVAEAGGALCPEKLSWSLAALQAAVQRARTLSQEGERLIEHKHYAVDSIRPKCHELRHLCDQFAADVERRRGLLGKSLELHGLLEAVGPTPNPDPAPGPAGPLLPGPARPALPSV